MKNQKAQKIIIILIVLLLLGGNGVVLAENLLRSADLGEPGFSLSYLETFGVTGEPYVFTNNHINHPMGLFVDSSGALFVAEQNGFRVMKFDVYGDFIMEFGENGEPWHHDHYLYDPSGVTVGDDEHVWVVMSNAIKEYAANGDILQSYPEEDQWESGSGNDQFDQPYQAIFNNVGNQLFVSDRYNNRIQVFDLGVDNALTYADTITGGFDQPHGLAFDAAGDLFVADYGNHQIQHCVYSSGWTCNNFIGTAGVEGDDLDKLSFAVGVYINGNDLFVADGGNQRVLKCETTTGDCVVFVNGALGDAEDQLTYLTGITGDLDNIYISDKDNHRVQVYDLNGAYVRTYGVYRTPYETDDVRMNKPVGIAIGPDNSMYVTELRGHRLIKMDADGNQVWTVGEAGIYGNDNGHFGTFWGGIQGNPAVGSNNRIYVADTPNNRIQVFNADGSFYMTYGEYGQANHQFDFPTSVAISPINGDVYVADTNNQRVQVFNANFAYKATLGVTGQAGDSSLHFNYPNGVAIDAEGAIYVGDYDNFRVQKCTLNATSYNCQTLIGETGVDNGEFGQIFPKNVAVDAEGRVYVSDDWDSRIQVFDADGAFLTSVGGEWGSNTSQFSSIGGIAFDTTGDVFVVDPDNHRIQKFTIGVPDWTQVNINGFGVPSITSIESLIEFNGHLYASTGDWEKGGQIWRSADGSHWTAVSQPGFGEAANSAIISMIVFDGQLYAGTGWGDGVGQVWRSSNGEDWVKIIGDGFGNPDNIAVLRFVIYDDVLYAATGINETGAEIYRSLSGNSGSWENVLDGGNGNFNNYAVNSFVIFSGDLYAAGENREDGAEVWRTSNGSDWAKVNTNGFGNTANQHIGSIIEFNGALYASTRNDETGAEIFRSPNGTTWTKVIGSGINDSANYKIESLFVFKGEMYVVANNDETGLKVWRSDDGVTFTQLIDDGFGDSNNTTTLWNSATIEYNNQLYVVANNNLNGAELWRFGTANNLYLPLIVK